MDKVYWHEHTISREDREKLNRNKGCVVWFTGLSASGKSTIANLLDCQLYEMGLHSAVLDGDNVRHTLNAGPNLLKHHGEQFAQRFGLGFSAQDRQENIRRIGCVAKLLCDIGIITITAFISPYRADRENAKAMVNKNDFIEVFVDTPIEVCETRDPKGLYKKARAGEIKGFTGVDDPYEPPKDPDLTLDGTLPPKGLVQQVIAFLKNNGKI
jgi:adenylylsulfate kinase